MSKFRFVKSTSLLCAVRMATAAALALIAFYGVGHAVLDDFALDLGSLTGPTPRYLMFAMCWAVFGPLAAKPLAKALWCRWGSRAQIDGLTAQLNAVPERRLLMWMCSAAFAIPLLLRLQLLQGAPLADDEGAYRFAAQLIASGRLWVPSPELKLFFDQNFMINDGRLYPAYFLGWPAILAIGELFNASGAVNPILSALTIPALHRVLRHFTGPVWAAGGIVLFLSSPFIQVAAATQLSHTSCFMALTWSLAMLLRTRRPDASVLAHVGFSFFLALAFCIRPHSTIAMAVPLVVAWALSLSRLERPARVRAALAFVFPSTVLAAIFLAALWAQNGSPWLSGYVRYGQYIAMNGFRFAGFTPEDLTPIPGFDFSQFAAAIGNTAGGLFRLNFDLFGWRSSFAFILMGLPWLSPGARLMWAMIGAHLGLMFFMRDWGIDTFGPVHAFELSLPILVLTIISARKVTERFTWTSEQGAVRPNVPMFPPFLFAALIVSAWLGFAPVRLRAVHQIAARVNQALRAPENAGLHRAVIFAPWPFAPPCNSTPQHFVGFRPVNDPDLRNDVLWVNHIDLESNRRLLETLPGRTGYVMRWTATCEVVLLPLTTLKDGDIPPAVVDPALRYRPHDR